MFRVDPRFSPGLLLDKERAGYLGVFSGDYKQTRPPEEMQGASRAAGSGNLEGAADYRHLTWPTMHQGRPSHPPGDEALASAKATDWKGFFGYFCLFPEIGIAAMKQPAPQILCLVL